MFFSKPLGVQVCSFDHLDWEEVLEMSPKSPTANPLVGPALPTTSDTDKMACSAAFDHFIILLVAGRDIMVEPGHIEQGEEPEPGEEEEVGEEKPWQAEQGGGDEKSHPEEDSKSLHPPLKGNREGGELDP